MGEKIIDSLFSVVINLKRSVYEVLIDFNFFKKDHLRPTGECVNIRESLNFGGAIVLKL